MSLDGVLNEILVADTNDGPTEVKKTAWAVYAGEELNKAQKIAWCKSWRSDLESNGFSALLRGQEPYELAKLKERNLLTVPEAAEPTVGLSSSES